MTNFAIPGALLIVSILLILKSRYVFAATNSSNDKSICKRYHRVTVTKLASYRETYTSYQDYDYPSIELTRLNFRIENVTKWQPIEMCCEGYEPHQQAADAEICVPVCPSGCINGTCMQPNKCTCNDGYKMEINKLTEYSECVPICASGCHGGNCIAPNTCACDYGYELTKDHSSCEPTCTAIHYGGHHQGCGGNASCIMPDMCQCNVGYTAVENVTDGKTSLKKELSLDHEPFFNTSKIICEPVCEPECGENSSCRAPNECQCNDGYNRSQSAKDRRCYPLCEKICFNGFCESPNKCACLEGYKPHRVLNEDMCEPICDKECVNAICSRPNHCECLDGYEKLRLRTRDNEQISENICTPICSGRCPNGTCISPGQCQCNEGYILNSLQHDNIGNDAVNISSRGNPSDPSLRQTCQPLCKPNCSKGSTCIAPNHCWTDSKRDRQDFNDFLKLLTKVVTFPEECDNDDNLYRENDTCRCKYKWKDQTCTRNALCAVLFTDDVESEKKFIDLQSLVFRNNTSGQKYFNRWQDSTCTDKCRILVIPKQHQNATDRRIKQCYLLQMHNVSTGLVLATNKVPFFISLEKQLTICSLNIEPTCSPSTSSVASGRIGALVGAILGAILLIGLIVGISIIIYLTRKKGRTIGVFGPSRSNGNMLERTERMESSLHIVDNSHL